LQGYHTLVHEHRNASNEIVRRTRFKLKASLFRRAVAGGILLYCRRRNGLGKFQSCSLFRLSLNLLITKRCTNGNGSDNVTSGADIEYSVAEQAAGTEPALKRHWRRRRWLILLTSHLGR
jgi:hypothetical protein